MTSAPAAGPKDISGETIPIIFPVPARVFETRAARLHAVAPGHAVGPYIKSMARLAEAQLAALSAAPFERNVTAELAARALRERDVHSAGAAWQRVLEVIVSEMREACLPEPSRAALARLHASAPAELESFATKILHGDHQQIDLAASAFVGAALQVHFTVLASRIRVGGPGGAGRGCPLCGSSPVAALVLAGRGLRYLCCSLCATRWYLPRLTCTLCNSTDGIVYFILDGEARGIKAEACAKCRAYLKLFYLEDRPAAEPGADDLATLALDLLMSEKGYSRSGPNLLLLA